MGDGKNTDNAAPKATDENEKKSPVLEWLDRLRKSPFGLRAGDFAKGEINRFLGVQPSSAKMDASRAQSLSNGLHQILAYLIAECKEEQKKLKTGGVLGFGGRDITAQDVDTAIAGFTAMTFTFETQMMEHLREARKAGSAVAYQFLPPATDDSGEIPIPQTSIAGGLGGRGVVGALALPADRLRMIATQLRQIHEYAIQFATSIQEDIAGPHGASPNAHDKALNKAIILVHRLDASCAGILQMLDPTIDPRTISTGNTGKLQALPSSDGRGSNR